jgi:hypothetical protein
MTRYATAPPAGGPEDAVKTLRLVGHEVGDLHGTTALDVEAVERAVQRASLVELLLVLADAYEGDVVEDVLGRYDDVVPCPRCQARGQGARILFAASAGVAGVIWECSRCKAAGTIWGARAEVLADPKLMGQLCASET